MLGFLGILTMEPRWIIETCGTIEGIYGFHTYINKSQKLRWKNDLSLVFNTCSMWGNSRWNFYPRWKLDLGGAANKPSKKY
jgi:hypothetical protein